MKRFEYEGVEYVTGLENNHGMAYPSVYQETTTFGIKSKKNVYIRSDIMWGWQTAMNSRPDEIEYHDNQVIAMFKRHKEDWKGKENPFEEKINPPKPPPMRTYGSKKTFVGTILFTAFCTAVIMLFTSPLWIHLL